MAVDISVDETSGIIVAKADGDLGANDIREGLVGVWQRPEFRTRARVLWDLRNANAADLPSSDLRNIAAFESRGRPEHPPVRLAFLVARDVEFGLARMVGVFSEDHLIEQNVFRDDEEARRWLTE